LSGAELFSEENWFLQLSSETSIECCILQHWRVDSNQQQGKSPADKLRRKPCVPSSVGFVQLSSLTAASPLPSGCFCRTDGVSATIMAFVALLVGGFSIFGGIVCFGPDKKESYDY
jgi:hypothetical protein